MTDNDTERTIALYSEMVYRLAFARMLNRADAEDVYQEVFLRYVRKAPPFRDEEHRKAWLIRVTINCAVRAAKKRAKSIPSDDIENENTVQWNGSEHIELLEALSSLPLKYREVIHLFYFEDMPAERIAQTLGRRRSTVLSQLARGRKMLKSLLEEE